MLKISLNENGHSITCLRLEGRLAGPWVAELKAAFQRLVREGRVPRLNLANVTFVDDDGLELLVEFRRDGVILTDCSPFVTEQLRSAPHS